MYLQFLDLDVPKPDLHSRITFRLGALQRDVSRVVLAVSGHPGELRSGDQLVPVVIPQLRVDDLVAVLKQLKVTAVRDDLKLVPLSGGLHPLNIVRDHVKDIAGALHQNAAVRNCTGQIRNLHFDARLPGVVVLG